MRLRALCRLSWAVWLGVLALAFNAAVPVHLAFDLAAALSEQPAAQYAGHQRHDHDQGGRPRHHPADHGNACQFCAAAVTLAGFALPPAAALPPPPVGDAARLATTPTRFALKTAPAPYRSRAPPSA